jgi:hypothetical protein
VVVVHGRCVTTAAVGDSLATIDLGVSCGFAAPAARLSPEHRLDTSAFERERIVACGGEVRATAFEDGKPVGPLRVWPGGLAGEPNARRPRRETRRRGFRAGGFEGRRPRRAARVSNNPRVRRVVGRRDGQAGGAVLGAARDRGRRRGAVQAGAEAEGQPRRHHRARRRRAGGPRAQRPVFREAAVEDGVQSEVAAERRPGEGALVGRPGELPAPERARAMAPGSGRARGGGGGGGGGGRARARGGGGGGAERRRRGETRRARRKRRRRGG